MSIYFVHGFFLKPSGFYNLVPKLASWVCDLCSFTQPLSSEGPNVWFNALLSPFDILNNY